VKILIFREPENKDKNLKLTYFSLNAFKRKYAFTNLYLFSRFLFFNFHFLILSTFSKKIILDFRGSLFRLVSVGGRLSTIFELVPVLRDRKQAKFFFSKIRQDVLSTRYRDGTLSLF
jgi:hypothetical protein